MKQTKMSLQNLKGKLSRSEMKNIMAGSAPFDCQCESDRDCGGNAPFCNKNMSCDNGKTTGACRP